MATAISIKEWSGMAEPIETRPGWFKSSHSGGGNDCVEVNAAGTAISDTKDPQHRAIQTTPESIQALLKTVSATPSA